MFKITCNVWRSLDSPFLILLNRFQDKSSGIILFDDYFDISGMFGLSITYENIFQIDIVSEMPDIGMRTNGYYFMSICKGYFILEYIGNAYLNLNLKYPPYIRIILENDTFIFINFNNEKDTTELYDNLVRLTLDNK